MLTDEVEFNGQGLKAFHGTAWSFRIPTTSRGLLGIGPIFSRKRLYILPLGKYFDVAGSGPSLNE
jgi:hypothetical protein